VKTFPELTKYKLIVARTGGVLNRAIAADFCKPGRDGEEAAAMARQCLEEKGQQWVQTYEALAVENLLVVEDAR